MTEADEAKFVEEFRPFVERVATNMRRRLGLTHELEDLVGYGMQGAWEVREQYLQLREGSVRMRLPYPSFPQFAHYRVRGAVLDGVRKMGQLTRRQRERLRLEEGIDSITEPWSAKPKKPRGREDTVRAIDFILGAVAAACVVGASTEDADDDAGGSPEAALLEHQRKALVRKEVAKLDERERRIIEGYYLKGRRLDDVIGDVGLSRSRGRHLHNRALGKLRDALKSA